jgi:hypothetical protein
MKQQFYRENIGKDICHETVCMKKGEQKVMSLLFSTWFVEEELYFCDVPLVRKFHFSICAGNGERRVGESHTKLASKSLPVSFSPKYSACQRSILRGLSWI